MTAYVAAGWAVAIVAIIAYAVAVISRGRSLSRRIPPEDRRWM
jgi:hypothetical protein